MESGGRRLVRLGVRGAPDIQARPFIEAPGGGAAERAIGPPRNVAGNPVVLSPYLFMPPEGSVIRRQATASVAGGASWTIPAAIRQLIPGGSYGVIKTFGVTVANMVSTTDITWSLRVNDAPVPGLGAYTIAARAAAFVDASEVELTISVPENGSVAVNITVNDGGGYTVGAYYTGWYAPRGVFERYTGA